MTDLLQNASIAIPAAMVLVVIALICNTVILTSKKSAITKVKAKNAVPAEAGVAGAKGGGSSVTTTISGESTTERPGKSRPKRSGLAAYATAFVLVALVLLTAYLVIRMTATGHGPFANQHEFAISFTWGILLAYLIVEWRYQIRMLSVIVLPVVACLLLYGMQLDDAVEPLVPALQNSVLLTLHVGCAILAYGAACVSFGAAVIYLIYPKLKMRSKPRQDLFDEIGYKAAVVTFPLLTIMIVLGAIWADTAWGRYWGWDPKETAALVTWLIYGAFLHARVVRGWQGKKAAWLLVVGFAAVLFAYFGNHFFGGLHSYG